MKRRRRRSPKVGVPVVIKHERKGHRDGSSTSASAPAPTHRHLRSTAADAVANSTVPTLHPLVHDNCGSRRLPASPGARRAGAPLLQTARPAGRSSWSAWGPLATSPQGGTVAPSCDGGLASEHAHLEGGYSYVCFAAVAAQASGAGSIGNPGGLPRAGESAARSQPLSMPGCARAAHLLKFSLVPTG